MKHLLFGAYLSLLLTTGSSQVYHVIVAMETAKEIMPEHGFLPGKNLQFYPTINKYDFSGEKIRAEFYEQRDSLKIKKIGCSEVEINNGSEFAGQNGVYTVKKYFQTLFLQSGIILDSNAQDTLKIYLEALDSRLMGFGSITAHGLCQMRMEFKDLTKSYCVDITYKSAHSPISRNALVTRKTATRVILSASIREVIELFLIDLRELKITADNQKHFEAIFLGWPL